MTSRSRQDTRPDRLRRLSPWLKERYGEKVFKVSLRGGFTCPNRDGTIGVGGCTFCSLAALEPVGFEPEASVARQLRRGMDYIRRRHKARKFISYFQDYTATYGPVDQLRRLYEPAIAPPEVVGLAVGTRPDCLPPRVLDLLADLNQRTDVTVELGLQVANDAVLQTLNRCHTVEDLRQGVLACHARGLPVCVHVILGLPGASPDDERRTADLLTDLGVWGVKIHSFHVIEKTPLAKDYAAGRFGVITLEEYAARAVEFLERLAAEIIVHRWTGEAPRDMTVAPEWTVNKMAVHNAVLATLVARDTWQGRLLATA